MTRKRSADASAKLAARQKLPCGGNVDKSVDKSADSRKRNWLPDGRVAPGRGPAKGAPNAGRPPDWWREKMRELRDRWLVAADAEGIVDDPNHPAWERIGRTFHEAIDGKPASAVDVTTGGKPLAGVVVLPPTA